MSENLANFETLDLRFRAVPQKSGRAWLPGGAWVWFIMGLAIGVMGWIYGRRELVGRLSKQLSSENTATSLFALEALDSLNPQTLDYLVTGLSHSDPRVARSAYQKLNLHMDTWANADVTLQYAAMKSLADQLQTISTALPNSNLALVRSIAARLYSNSVSIDDPQIKPVADICERLLAIPDRINQQASEAQPDILQVPPAPLKSLSVPAVSQESPPPEKLAQESKPAETESIERSSSNSTASLHLVARPTRPRSSSTENSRVANSDSVDTIPIDETASNPMLDDATFNTSTNSTSQKPELPLIVASPASISSHPVARFRTVSTQPDLAGIEKLEIAELLRLLAHENPDIAKAAAMGLRHKGMSDQKIQLATELAMGSAARRIELIQQIATSGSLDPRPWLIWMGEDAEPEVRKVAVSYLIPMADESVYRSLRNLAARESDVRIKEMITRALLTVSK